MRSSVAVGFLVFSLSALTILLVQKNTVEEPMVNEPVPTDSHNPKITKKPPTSTESKKNRPSKTTRSALAETLLAGADPWPQLHTLSPTEIPNAVQAVLESPLSARRQAVPLSYLLSRLARHSPVEAANYALSLENKENRIRSLRGIITQWSLLDPESAGTWLNKLPNSISTDEAFATYAASIERDDPSAAITWANAIKNERLRLRTLDRIE